MEIDREALQAVFDVAVGSMDFSSGFLDHEEVLALRRVAVALGVDPMFATPNNFECEFSGKHQWRHEQPWYPTAWDLYDEKSMDRVGRLRGLTQCMRCSASMPRPGRP